MSKHDLALVPHFAEKYAELRALFTACEDRKAVMALAKRIDAQLDGGRWVDGVFQEPETEVPACSGALMAFKAEALAYHYVPKTAAPLSGKEMRVQMADRYLSRSNRVGRLR
jgi:hypothetical protein